jgi:hypothetical protein
VQNVEERLRAPLCHAKDMQLVRARDGPPILLLILVNKAILASTHNLPRKPVHVHAQEGESLWAMTAALLIVAFLKHSLCILIVKT